MPEHRCPQGIYTKRNDPVTKRQILYDVIHTRILETTNVKQWIAVWGLPRAMRGRSEELVFTEYRISV